MSLLYELELVAPSDQKEQVRDTQHYRQMHHTKLETVTEENKREVAVFLEQQGNIKNGGWAAPDMQQSNDGANRSTASEFYTVPLIDVPRALTPGVRVRHEVA